jgi:flagellar FliL protein
MVTKTLYRTVGLFMLCSAALFAQAEEEGEAAAPKAQYVELSPAFVANFGGTSAKLKYIKADISLRVPSEDAADLIEANKALVRHQIVMRLSAQSDEQMAAPDSQESIRKEALKSVQSAMSEETGAPQVDDLLFTSFVVQR